MLSFCETGLSCDDTLSRLSSPSDSLPPISTSPSLASTPNTSVLTTATTPSTPSSSQLPVKQSPRRTAAVAQHRGVQHIKSGLSKQLLALEARAKPSADCLVSDTPSNTVSAPPTAAECAAANQKIVEEELHRYKALTVPLHIDVDDGVDLLRFWDVRLLPATRHLHELT
jgi:hypothetical protein